MNNIPSLRSLNGILLEITNRSITIKDVRYPIHRHWPRLFIRPANVDKWSVTLGIGKRDSQDFSFARHLVISIMQWFKFWMPRVSDVILNHGLITPHGQFSSHIQSFISWFPARSAEAQCCRHLHLIRHLSWANVGSAAHTDTTVADLQVQTYKMYLSQKESGFKTNLRRGRFQTQRRQLFIAIEVL